MEVNVVNPGLVVADVMQDCFLGIDFLGKHDYTINFQVIQRKLVKRLWASRGIRLSEWAHSCNGPNANVGNRKKYRCSKVRQIELISFNVKVPLITTSHVLKINPNQT